MYETLSTQTDFVDTKHYEDAASQTEGILADYYIIDRYKFIVSEI